jgi:glucose-1-phosphate thymidylyltransferase
MQAIIPVAGIGSRLRPHTHTQPKSLIPVAGKPILGHIVDILIQEGFDEIVFIIGYLGDKIESYITHQYPQLTSRFVIQTTGKGIGHALWLAKDQVDLEKELFIVLGDTIFDADLKKVFAGKNSSLGVMKVEDPRDFGVALLDEKGHISLLVEKPRIPKSNLALIGAYYLKNAGRLMEALDYNIQNNIRTSNEFHLTDALMRLVEQGEIFDTFTVDAWFDCGKKDILLETNATLLKRMNAAADPDRYPGCILIPPIFIAETAVIKSSVIGPNVSIGEEAVIDHSIVRESIIGPHAHLEYAVLRKSLIGNDATLKGMVQSLNLGDSTEINFEQ